MMPSASGSASTFSFVGDIGEMRHQHVGIDPAQIKTLAARQHRHRHFSNFGGGEHEFGVLRRLFQRLEERVERRGREHVDFVDDVDLVARAGGRIAHAVIDLAHVVDAGMGRGVHFQHVHVPAFHDRLAVHAERGHVDGRAFDRTVRQFVVQRARQNPRRGGLADPAHAGQDPGLRNSPGFERVGDGADHGLLADQVVKAGGAVFACQHAVGRARTRRRRRLRRRDRSRPDGRCPGRWGALQERQRRSSIDPQMIVSRSRLAEQREQIERKDGTEFARFARKNR